MVDNINDAENLIKEYRELLLGDNYAKTTIDTYCRTAQWFLTHLAGKPPSKADSNDLHGFLTAKKESGYQDASLTMFKQAIKHFVKVHSASARKIDADFTTRREAVVPLSAESVVKIINSTPARHRLMFAMIYYFGLQKQILLDIRFGDIKLSRKSLFIRFEGKDTREVAIPHQLLGPIDNQLQRVMLQHELDCLDNLNRFPLELTVYPPSDSLENQFFFQSQSSPQGLGYRPSHEQSSFTKFLKLIRKGAGLDLPLSVSLFRMSSLWHHLADGKMDVDEASEYFNYGSKTPVYEFIRGLEASRPVIDVDHPGGAVEYVLDNIRLSA